MLAFQHIIEVCSVILTDPFALMYPPLQIASLMVLEQSLVCGWPRIQRYKADILKPLIICWLDLEGSGISAIQEEEIREQMRSIFRVLSAVPEWGSAGIEVVRGILRGNLEIQELLKPFHQAARPSRTAL